MNCPICGLRTTVGSTYETTEDGVKYNNTSILCTNKGCENYCGNKDLSKPSKVVETIKQRCEV